MSGNITEKKRPPESEVPPQSIGIAVSTRYANWYPGALKKGVDVVDKIRGDLAIQTLTAAKRMRFQIALVDDGSSSEFRDTLSSLEIGFKVAEEKGMGPGKRQAFREAAGLRGVKVIIYDDPEKVSLITDCLPEIALPVYRGEADIVIPKRDDEAFATYPSHQAEHEQKANKLWNYIVKQEGLRPEGCPDLDMFFGPRVFKNDPEVLKLFIGKYKYDKRGIALDDVINPELWSNALFSPIVVALNEGKLRIISVDVKYSHPTLQTEIETDNKEYESKRAKQYRDIILTTTNLIKLLKGQESRMHLDE